MANFDKLFAEQAGINLDIGCGEGKQDGYIGLDIRDLPGVDIIHDINIHPWPIPDNVVRNALASHIVEHVPPVAFIDGATRFLFVELMDEVWRIMRPGGSFAIVVPHAYSRGFAQDPTHINPCNEITWGYFAPGHPSGLYNIYRPRPWRIKMLSWAVEANIEVLLEKVTDEQP